MKVERGIHELDEVIEGEKLCPHAGLIAEEVAFLVYSSELGLLERSMKCMIVDRGRFLALHLGKGHLQGLQAQILAKGSLV